MQNAGLDADIQSILLTANPDRAGPEKGHRNYKRAGALLLWRKVESVGVVQSRDEMALGHLTAAFQYTKGTYKKKKDFLPVVTGQGAADQLQGCSEMTVIHLPLSGQWQ